VAGVIGAVVFDAGECLVDETREYGTWADWLGVPRHVFSAVSGAVIARGQDYRETFQVFQPGFDLAKARQHRVRQVQAQMAAGERWHDHGLIFSSEIGTPMDPENFSRSFSRLCQRSGLGHWHPHELRHPGASLMLAQGTPLHVVSDVLGHASIAITKDVYGHLLEGTSRRRRSP
jgi:integrase